MLALLCDIGHAPIWGGRQGDAGEGVNIMLKIATKLISKKATCNTLGQIQDVDRQEGDEQDPLPNLKRKTCQAGALFAHFASSCVVHSGCFVRSSWMNYQVVLV